MRRVTEETVTDDRLSVPPFASISDFPRIAATDETLALKQTVERETDPPDRQVNIG